MNNSEGGNLQKAGAGTFGGCNQTALAQFTVGEIGFGPAWSAEDSLAAANVRLHYELEEANARIAVLEQEQNILKGDSVRIAIDAKSWARLSQERDALAEALRESQATIESLRDTLCEYKCRDKARADGGWANI
jgi:hypothetical protein